MTISIKRKNEVVEINDNSTGEVVTHAAVIKCNRRRGGGLLRKQKNPISHSVGFKTIEVVLQYSSEQEIAMPGDLICWTLHRVRALKRRSSYLTRAFSKNKNC